MIWAICAILAVLAMVLAGICGANKKLGSLRSIYALLLLFAATFALYLPPYLRQYDGLSAVLGNLINMLQVVSLNADYLQFYEDVRAGIGNVALLAEGYMLLLGLIHLLMPMLSAVTAVTVFLRYFSRIQLRLIQNSRKPLYIFSEMNERTLCLAASLPKKSRILFCDCGDDTVNSRNEAYRGYMFRGEKIDELGLKHRPGREVYYLLISADEDATLGAGLRLMQQLSDQSRNIHIFLFSGDRDYTVYVDSQEKGELDVRCYNECDIMAYNLLDAYPLYRWAQNGTVHVLIHGLTPVNTAFLKAAAWCGQICNVHLKLSVVGVDIRAGRQELQRKAPALFGELFDIHFYDCDSRYAVQEAVREHCADANYILVDDGSDNETMETGIALRRLFYRMDEKFQNCPPIFCCVRDTAKAEMIGSLKTAEAKEARKVPYDLIPFGSLASVYDYRQIVDSDLEDLAKNVHLAYEEIFSAEPICVEDALRRYYVFEVNKRSNRANALHIRYKLGALGLDYTRDPQAREADFAGILQASLEKLAVSEHDRWMAFLITEGWLASGEAQVEAYRASGISRGRHNCPLLKLHPYICAFDKLRDMSIRLEGKDTTRYDVELVARIPDILSDKWKVSGKTYKIVKMQDENVSFRRNGNNA